MSTETSDSEESCVRLFISVDLVGSTAYKNRHETELTGYSREGPPWASTFKGFYNGFPKTFEQTLGKEQQVSLEERLRPKLIKTIGDEVFLQTRIEGCEDALKVIRFLAKALVHYKKKNLPEPTLHLKATAWIAGFPINNHRVAFEEEGGKPGGEDFIGPSIDTGFRIARWSSPTKMAVTVDLALLLLSAEAEEPLEIYFDGSEPLKGVLGGLPYPIIWLRIAAEGAALHKAELALLDKRPEPRDLLEYCEQYIRTAKSWLIRPYFQDDSKFNDKPAWHETLLKAWAVTDMRNAAGADVAIADEVGVADTASAELVDR